MIRGLRFRLDGVTGDGPHAATYGLALEMQTIAPNNFSGSDVRLSLSNGLTYTIEPVSVWSGVATVFSAQPSSQFGNILDRAVVVEFVQ